MKLVQTAVGNGARLSRACAVIGLSARTYQRWVRAPQVEDQRRGPLTPPKHKLSAEEEQALIALANEPAHRNLTPEQIVATAADQGRYIASERSMRRVLARHRLDRYRNRAKPAKHHKPRELAASGPLQVLSWDITYLSNSRIRGGYFYLYLFVDIWSRQIVGSEVHDNQSGDLAAQLLKNICIEHDIQADQATLHADNGAPMKGATMLATMHALGIVKSFSRPRVSDDNPFVESLFRHLKYAPSYPSHGFESLEAAKAWVARFVDWYNNQHLHSGIGYVTPAQRHEGLDVAVLEHRCRVYADARQRNPRRWTRRTRLWDRTEVVFLNPDRIVHTRVTSDSVAKNSARLGSGMG